ncbi:MAG TPA: COX15/CtaA family protein [Methylophilaceae bacterium]|nr:COX15/CtaA family protein [Methylophilaceae bacterium]
MKPDSNTVIWFKRVVLLSALLAICVVGLGAYVRLSDAGLGCPDWPGCYGYMSVPESEAAIAQAQAFFPDSPLEAHKAWKEMVHRYLAGILGLLILSLCVLGWRDRENIQVSPWTPTALLILVTFQAALGMWTVTMLLKPAIVTAHLLGGMATLGLLVWITHRHWGSSSEQYLPAITPRVLIRGAVIVLFAQIMLGGWTSSNYAALACTDFPTCHNEWMPPMDFSNGFHWIRELGEGINGTPMTLEALTAIQWTHRIGALIVFIYLGGLGVYLLKYAKLRATAVSLVVLLLVQIALGVANLVLHLPLVLAVAHNLGAALLLVTLVILNSKITGSGTGRVS